MLLFFNKLRWRLMLSYLMPILMMMAIIAYAQSRLTTAVERSDELNATAILTPDILIIGDSCVRMQRAAYAYVLTNGNQNSDQGYPKSVYDESRNNVYEKLDEIAHVDNIGRLTDGTRNLKNAFLKIEQSTQQIIKLVDDGKVKEAQDMILAGATIAQSRVIDQLTKDLLQSDFDFRIKVRDSVSQEIENAKKGVLIGSVIAAVAMAAFGIWVSLALSRSILANANQVASASSQIASTMTQHEQTVLQQSSAVAETTTTVEEIAASSRITSEQAESVAISARQAQETTQQGMVLAARNQNEMTELEKRMTHIAGQILGLSEQAAQIGNISRLVSELAGETNMLALNAAVEAARAGEHGKGFSVVAAEIRKLADQSKQSAERANQIVADIQKATNSIVMTAEEGSKTSRNVAESVRQAVESFESVNKLSNSVYQNAQQVLLNSKQQATALSQIDEAMKNIKDGAREISTGTSQARAGLINLIDVAGKLKLLL